MSEEIEFDPCDHITVGAVGPPGQRTFYLQARRGEQVVSLVVEKDHVVAIGQGANQLLTQVGYPEPLMQWDEESMALAEALEPAFRVGAISMSYVEDRDLVLIECRELVPEGEAEAGDPSSARLWINRAQLEALGKHGLAVAARGRPTCPMCGVPMDPSGHRCFAMNGHRDEV